MANLYIVTGTSRGLGEAFLNLLATEHKVININRKKANSKTENIYDLCINLAHVNTDNIKEFEHLLSQVLTADIEKAIFINNAFTMGTLAKIDKLNNQELIESFHTNIISSYLLIKSFIHQTQHLAVKKYILNISSGAAQKAIDGWSLYCMGKASMEMFIRSINLEYPQFNAYNIDPGVMDTHLQSDIRNFTEGTDNKYFVDLFQNRQLKKPNTVAQEILQRYT